MSKDDVGCLFLIGVAILVVGLVWALGAYGLIIIGLAIVAICCRIAWHWVD